MHDKELLDRLTDNFPWMREIYEKYCDAVHFSTDHVQQSLRHAFLAPSAIDSNFMSQQQFIEERLCKAISDLLMVTQPLIVAATSYLQGRRTLVSEAVE